VSQQKKEREAMEEKYVGEEGDRLVNQAVG